MIDTRRKLSMDVFDYKGNKMCSLYDNSAEVQGEASTIVISTERNGWKELSFQMPSKYIEDGENTDNYRLDFLKADYRIRTIDDKETDWFLISEPKVVHQAFSKNVSVSAGHISQLLKVKNLGLEFSDDEGNNVGTPETFLDVILDGTGWEKGIVETFYEKNGVDIKYRSMKASTKTGAFKLISTMCDLFDAKPVYHAQDDRIIENYDGQGNTYYGNGRKTVDILPINPFSEPEEGELPDVTKADGVIELCYGKNVKKLQRTLKTENIVTKLYAYGAYGDDTDGYCGIDIKSHTEYEMAADVAVTAGMLYYFTVEDDSGIDITRCFTATKDAVAGTKFMYSFLDPASMSYVWDVTNEKAYPVTVGMQSGAICLCASPVKKTAKNWFSFIMDFSYYRKVGLMTDDMIQKLGEYQRKGPEYLNTTNTAAEAFATSRSTVTKTIGSVNYAKLSILEDDISGAYHKLKLNVLTGETPETGYEHGVIYRTDYYAKEDKQFEWNYTEKLDDNGDPKNEVASMLLIAHNTDPITWDKCYLKYIDDEDDPLWLTTWLKTDEVTLDLENDQFFLFQLNNINGYLGALEANDEAALLTLESKTKTTKTTTVNHKTYFSKTKPEVNDNELNGYGWWWKYDDSADSEFYFCYTDDGDTDWHRVYIATEDSVPLGETRDYWYDWQKASLYRMAGTWTKLEEQSDTYINGEYNNKRVTRATGIVYMQCLTRDKLYKGVYEYYTYTVGSDGLKAGSYYFDNGYKTDLCFTTDDDLTAGATLVYDSSDGWITQTDADGNEEFLDVKNKTFNAVEYHSSNIMSETTYEDGRLDEEGESETAEGYFRNRQFLACIEKTPYVFTGLKNRIYICLFDEKYKIKRTIASTLFGNFEFETAAGEKYIKFYGEYDKQTFASEDHKLYSTVKDIAIISDDVNYIRLDTVKSGEVKGIIAYIDKFVSTSNTCFITNYSTMIAAQAAYNTLNSEFMNSIGDVYREGYWQKSDYVEGDEQKLYNDALENLEKISQPEATYNIEYLDLYGTDNDEMLYTASGEADDAKWPDLSISSAVHLIDDEIDINIWAFIDKISKCYDMPWKTSITINTNLTTMTQHSFTDVMSNIANVASQIKGNDTRKNSTSLDVSAGTESVVSTSSDGFALVTGEMTLGTTGRNKITSDGIISLGNGNIVMDGESNDVKICDAQGTVTIGANSADNITIGDYIISRDIEDSPFYKTYREVPSETAKTIGTKTYYEGDISTKTMGELYITKKTSVNNDGSGIGLYADTNADDIIIGPESKGSLCGWDAVMANRMTATNGDIETLISDKIYEGGQRVATQKFVIEAIQAALNELNSST